MSLCALTFFTESAAVSSSSGMPPSGVTDVMTSGRYIWQVRHHHTKSEGRRLLGIIQNNPAVRDTINNRRPGSRTLADEIDNIRRVYQLDKQDAAGSNDEDVEIAHGYGKGVVAGKLSERDRLEHEACMERHWEERWGHIDALWESIDVSEEFVSRLQGFVGYHEDISRSFKQSNDQKSAGLPAESAMSDNDALSTFPGRILGRPKTAQSTDELSTTAVHSDRVSDSAETTPEDPMGAEAWLKFYDAMIETLKHENSRLSAIEMVGGRITTLKALRADTIEGEQDVDPEKLRQISRWIAWLECSEILLYDDLPESVVAQNLLKRFRKVRGRALQGNLWPPLEA